jgi:hypothetical protein
MTKSYARRALASSYTDRTELLLIALEFSLLNEFQLKKHSYTVLVVHSVPRIHRNLRKVPRVIGTTADRPILGDFGSIVRDVPTFVADVYKRYKN